MKILEQLQRVSGADSQDFMHRIFAELIAVRRDAMLLSLPAAMLEPYLVNKSALTSAQQGGALTPDEARHLDLLAQLYAAPKSVWIGSTSRLLVSGASMRERRNVHFGPAHGFV